MAEFRTEKIEGGWALFRIINMKEEQVGAATTDFNPWEGMVPGKRRIGVWQPTPGNSYIYAHVMTDVLVNPDD